VARVPAEDIRQVATVIDGREYRASGGFFDMPDRDAKAHLASAGFGGSWSPVRGATGRRALGRRCKDCGFGSYFTTCSRCGGACQREGTDAPAQEA